MRLFCRASGCAQKHKLPMSHVSVPQGILAIPHEGTIEMSKGPFVD